TDSAAALLAACLIRFPNLGEIYNAMNDLKGLAGKLASQKDDAALLANSFIASVGSDGKVASNVVATLATALTGWASTDVRANTSASDFDADLSGSYAGRLCLLSWSNPAKADARPR